MGSSGLGEVVGYPSQAGIGHAELPVAVAHHGGVRSNFHLLGEPQVAWLGLDMLLQEEGNWFRSHPRCSAGGGLGCSRVGVHCSSHVGTLAASPHAAAAVYNLLWVWTRLHCRAVGAAVS